jgi:transcriptional regulator with XRE-family HTH domain
MRHAADRMDAYYREFGRRLRDARRQRWTQQDIANKVGLSRAAVANIELGRQRVPLHMIARFASALGVAEEALLPPNDLLADDEEPELRRLSRGDRAAVEEIIGSLTRRAERDPR